MQTCDDRLRRVPVIGVPITATNMRECLGFIEESLPYVRGEYICVSNAHTCVMAHDDPAYWAVQAESLMSVPDGKPLSVAGRRQVPSMGRVTGPDLMRELFAMSADRSWRHYFYGSERACLDALGAALGRDYPGLDVVGMEPSVFRPLSEREKAELAERITESGADFAWIGLGAPRQEILCHDLKGRTGALMVGVGGAFSVLAGLVPEAPRWMQDAGLEWLYRLAHEPRRLFKRYAMTNAKFIAYSLLKTPPKQRGGEAGA